MYDLRAQSLCPKGEVFFGQKVVKKSYSATKKSKDEHLIIVVGCYTSIKIFKTWKSSFGLKQQQKRKSVAFKQLIFTSTISKFHLFVH